AGRLRTLWETTVMNPELEVTVFDKGEKRCTHTFSTRLEVGRQRRASEALYVPLTSPEGAVRLVVAETTEDNVGRQHAEIEPLDNDRARITNLSLVQPIYFEGPTGPALMPREKREVRLPQLIRLGTSRVLRLGKQPGEPEAAPGSLAKPVWV